VQFGAFLSRNRIATGLAISQTTLALHIALLLHCTWLYSRLRPEINPQPSGGSGIFERGVQVQADYGNNTDCFIMAGEYVYAEAAKSAPIRAKRGNFSEFRTFEIASAGFSGPLQRALVRRSSKLPHLFHRPCGADSFFLLMACQTYYNFTVTHADKLPHCISN